MALKSDLFHSHDFAKLPVREIYRLMVSAIVPRPIAFVTTICENGVSNLAPFSFFNGVSSKPPCLVFSIARTASGGKKGTLLNIEQTGEFVINTAEEPIVSQVNAASEAFPHGVNEIDQVGLKTIPSIWVRPLRIAESAIQMECRLEKMVEIGEAGPGGSTLVIGRILGIHVADRVLENNVIQYEKLKPVARLGAEEWLRGGEVFRLPRP